MPTFYGDPIDVQPGGEHNIDVMAAAGLVDQCDEGHWHFIKPWQEVVLTMNAMFGSARKRKARS